MDTFLTILHQTVCGALAAAGFGVLFNVRFKMLPWCAASGALALAARTVCLTLGWNLEAASFCAALAVGVAVQLLRMANPVFSNNTLDVVGCIPMIPGGMAAKAILGLHALTAGHDPETLLQAMQATLRVSFILGALGTGVAMPTLLLRARAAR